MHYAFRLTQDQHTRIYSHLYPGDGKEAAVLISCGRRSGSEAHILTARRILPVPYSRCRVRTEEQVTWFTDVAEPLLYESFGKQQAIVKLHSHPTGYPNFSALDDASDRAIYGAIANFLDDGLPHASIVMLPDGALFGRAVAADGPLDRLGSIAMVGDRLQVWRPNEISPLESFTLRHQQAFGAGTTSLLRSLSVGVVGCSGTGSIVVEQLARLGVRKLVLVDPDKVEEKNLNRIVNSRKKDAYLGHSKAHVLASGVARMGLGQEVVPIATNLSTRTAVLALAECDVLFGCMDSADGRHLLNRVATFYSQPYFDLGVRLDADGKGGIATIAGAVHYIQPGRSSLLTRGVYTMARVEAEEIRRTNPDLYQHQREEGYLRGIPEDRPAVVSVNAFLASLALLEFLNRLHPYRNQDPASYAYAGVDLCELQFHAEPEGEPDLPLQGHVGRGDVEPLLDRPSLS